MKPHKVSAIGVVDTKGQFLISNKAELNDFLSCWKGAKIIMVATAYPEGGSNMLQGYYFKKVVPDFQRIFREKDGERLTLKETDEKLRGMSPVMIEEIPEEESGGFRIDRLKSIYEVGNSVMCEHVEFVRMIAAEEYGWDIANPSRK